MSQLPILLITFSGVFILGFMVAKVILTIRSHSNREALKPVENAKVRLKTSDALYRCRLVARQSESWVFTAPMHRDHYVPVAVGEEVKCEVVANGGLIMFTTVVTARNPFEGTVTVAAPKSVKLADRRSKTDRQAVDMQVIVAGKAGAVIDLSPGGAKVKIKGFEREGNMVMINLPTGETRGATVVDSKNDQYGSVIRLKFDEPIALLKD